MWREHEMGIVNKDRVHLVRFTGYTLRGNFHAADGNMWGIVREK